MYIVRTTTVVVVVSLSVSTALLLLPFRLRALSLSRALCVYTQFHLEIEWEQLHARTLRRIVYERCTTRHTIHIQFQCKCEWSERKETERFRDVLYAVVCVAMRRYEEHREFHFPSRRDVKCAIRMSTHSSHSLFRSYSHARERESGARLLPTEDRAQSRTHRRTYSARVFRIRSRVDS